MQDKTKSNIITLCEENNRQLIIIVRVISVPKPRYDYGRRRNAPRAPEIHAIQDYLTCTSVLYASIFASIEAEMFEIRSRDLRVNNRETTVVSSGELIRSNNGRVQNNVRDSATIR